MRIKRLEIHGFKSFAERTVVHFGDGITGVVGPNGCGKSNIVDALRWAMGEQSAKHLRGSGMDDVIFAGSESRGPMGLAEVTITFKNDGSLVPPEYKGLSEISVTRRLFRDGTSEYLINRSKSRLRDIHDLFLGTGIGTKSYSIIEQGRIGLIVTAKAEDRRSLIEDAAGISKYKARRKVAERKLDATAQNLLRVSDIVGELSGRIGHLQKQAERAEKYKAIKGELKDLDLHSAVHRFLELIALEQSDARSVESDRETLESEESALEQREAELKDALTDLEDREQALRAREIEAQRIEQAFAVGEKNVEHLLRELEGLEDRRTEAQNERELLVGQLEEARFEEKELVAAGEALVMTSGEETQQLGVEEQTLSTMAARIREEEPLLERNKQLLVECLTAIAQNRNNKDNLGRSTTDLDARIGRLEAEGAEADKESRAAEKLASELRKKLDDNRQLKLALEDERVTQEALLERLQSEFMDNEAQLLSIREELMDRRSRLSSLEEIQKNYEGCSAGVRAIMQHAREDDSMIEKVHGLVADVLSSEPKYETAIEAVLGERLQYVIVQDQDEGIASVRYLKNHGDGRSTFVPLDLREDHVSWAPRKATTRPPGRQTIPPEERLAARESLEDGSRIELRADGAPLTHFPTATPEPATSEILSAAKTISDKPPPAEVQAFAQQAQEALYGAQGADVAHKTALPFPVEIDEDWEDVLWPDLDADGVHGKLVDLVKTTPGYERVARVLLGDVVVVEDLERAQALWRGSDHRKTIVTLAGEVLDPVGILAGGSNQGASTGMLAQKREIKDLRRAVKALEERFVVAESTHKELSKRIQKIEESLQGLSDQRHEEELSIVKLEKDLRSHEETAARHREREAVVQLELEQIQKERRSVQDEIERSQLAIGELEAKQIELEARINEGIEALAKKKAAAQELADRVTELKVAVAASVERKESAERNLIRARERIREIEGRIERLTKNIGTSEDDATRLSQQIADARNEGGSLSQQIETNRMELAELRASLGAEEQTLRAQDVELREQRRKLDALKHDVNASFMKVREHQMAQQSLRDQIYERYQIVLDHVITDFHMLLPPTGEDDEKRKKLRRSLAGMGEINLMAIQEYEEVKERYDFLSSQKADLETAIEALKVAIKKINKTSKERYVETFHLINEKFQLVFPRLFKGGRASLVITDESNPLESGIELMAQPPGKKLQNVTLLSGGEKALTAVALIFSIFLIKPTPFCLLDEVDAPLDDANVGRYNDMVKDMAQISQFILITHNKRTMEIPDRIYGVTMEEPGISKLVGVDMKANEGKLRVAS